ncbi:MAG: YhfC family glutamic-type intramembrane protease [Peptoniphilaceae bacterium]|nr:YhfC family glutamic-type intramembrane protease [Peptoniphilaceae bacterium]
MKKFLKLFLLGMLCFAISQLCLRLPILKLLNNSLLIYNFQILYPLLYGFILSLSAGIFEEGCRFIFKDKFLKDSKSKLDAIIFGLGHGFIEVIYVFAISFNSLNLITNSEIFLGVYERILAMIFHVGMTVLIWTGFVRNKKYKYLILAIMMHGIFDYLIPLKHIFDFNNFILYGIWTATCIFILIFIVNINLGGINNEKF